MPLCSRSMCQTLSISGELYHVGSNQAISDVQSAIPHAWRRLAIAHVKGNEISCEAWALQNLHHK